MSNISVGYLSRRSLQVEAADSVTLRGITVTHLRQDALRGLQVRDTTSGVGSVSISGLTVRRADPGSLRFADGAPVTLTDLLLTGGCVCSTPSWAHQLLLGRHCGDEDGIYGNANTPLRGEECSFSGDGEGTFDGRSGGLAEEREALLQQIEAGLCTVDRGDSLSLADLTARHCGESADAGGLGGEPADCSPVLSIWWSYLGVILLTALLLMLAALPATAAVRYHRRRQKQRPDRLDRLELTGPGADRQCSADTAAAGGGQRGASPSCRPMMPIEKADQEPEAMYTDVIYRMPEDAHPTEKGPPVGGSQSEPPNAGPPRTEEECSCSAIGLYAVSEKTRGCSCKPPAQLNGSEPAYANMPDGEMATEPAAKIGAASQEYGYSNTEVRKCISINYAVSYHKYPIKYESVLVFYLNYEFVCNCLFYVGSYFSEVQCRNHHGNVKCVDN